ncbi:hypothetical protein BU26DRAFT_540745 [Trematosphaeria pertusa]|uniref:BZIP domain-containing protein n=1 Tax=Trematosphaeria pertusa TaxID=390896 RepID=A0A6A6IGN6_9PLEO|nr:uncharacterized protein BU26DRAFT_540745 [Trematosphaeria pertusa]KAF2249581.1 hypothetical protein BU26DRAFT_540745 [Trematosphaeria pertusa]
MAEPTIILQLEDWAGTTDPKERRRRQNRLNQRARKSSIRLISRLEAAACAEYALGTPRTDLLLGLVQLNVLRALIVNIDVLGFSAAEMHDDALSPFSTAGPWHTAHTKNQLPAALMPTSLQRSVCHHPWLDLLPIPQLRDNLLRASLPLDEDELCHDLCGFRSAAEGLSGVIVWKDPWDPTGWEITGTFLRRWGGMLKECWGLFQSTNYWRARRGESRLSCATWALACKET